MGIYPFDQCPHFAIICENCHAEPVFIPIIERENTVDPDLT